MTFAHAQAWQQSACSVREQLGFLLDQLLDFLQGIVERSTQYQLARGLDRRPEARHCLQQILDAVMAPTDQISLLGLGSI